MYCLNYYYYYILFNIIIILYNNDKCYIIILKLGLLYLAFLLLHKMESLLYILTIDQAFFPIRTNDKDKDNLN